MKPENKEQLISVLKYHVSPGRATGQDVGKLTDAVMPSDTIVLRERFF